MNHPPLNTMTRRPGRRKVAHKAQRLPSRNPRPGAHGFATTGCGEVAQVIILKIHPLCVVYIILYAFFNQPTDFFFPILSHIKVGEQFFAADVWMFCGHASRGKKGDQSVRRNGLNRRCGVVLFHWGWVFRKANLWKTPDTKLMLDLFICLFIFLKIYIYNLWRILIFLKFEESWELCEVFNDALAPGYLPMTLLLSCVSRHLIFCAWNMSPPF